MIIRTSQLLADLPLSPYSSCAVSHNLAQDDWRGKPDNQSFTFGVHRQAMASRRSCTHNSSCSKNTWAFPTFTPPPPELCPLCPLLHLQRSEGMSTHTPLPTQGFPQHTTPTLGFVHILFTFYAGFISSYYSAHPCFLWASSISIVCWSRGNCPAIMYGYKKHNSKARSLICHVSM